MPIIAGTTMISAATKKKKMEEITMTTPRLAVPLRSSRLRSLLGVPALAIGLFLGVTGAQAFNLDTDNQDLRVRFDNTLKLSSIYRLDDADEKLTDSFRLLVPGVADSAFPQALNFNAGDDNFRDKGIASKRFDLLSVNGLELVKPGSTRRK
jgi:hypothetical protein